MSVSKAPFYGDVPLAPSREAPPLPKSSDVESSSEPKIADPCACSPSWYLTDETAMVELQGFLQKEGKVHKNWKKRWFVLRKDGTVSYYTATNRKLKGVIQLENACLKEESSSGIQFSFMICAPDRTFHVHAESGVEKAKWMVTINTRIASILYLKAVRNGDVELDTQIIQFFHEPEVPYINMSRLSSTPMHVFAGVCHAIGCHLNLRRVTLENSDLAGGERLNYLIEALSKNTSVEELHLKNNCLNVEASEALAQLLFLNQKIQVLDLRDNSLNPESMQLMGPAMARHKHLSVIKLDGNPIESDGFLHLINALLEVGKDGFATHKLRSLSLNNCRLNDSCMERLRELMEHSHTLPALNELFLSGNQITDEGAILLAIGLEGQKPPSLRTLDISNNRIRGPGAVRCIEMLERVPNVVRCELGGNRLGEEALMQLGRIMGEFSIEELELMR